MKSRSNPAYIAFAGGGALGMAHLGAWQILARRFSIMGAAGTSAGSIVAAFCAAGYHPADAIQIFDELRWQEFVKPQPLFDLFKKRDGLIDGEDFEKWLKTCFAKYIPDQPQHVSFSDLYKATEIYLAVVACDLNKQQQILFDRNSEPKTSVAYAVRASISIPGYFVVVPRSDQGQILVDGGLVLNFPLEPLYPLAQSESCPLIGIRFEQPVENLVAPNVLDVLTRSYKLMHKPSGVIPSEIAKYPHFIEIVIDVSGYNLLNFKLSAKEKDELVRRGADAAAKALLEYDSRLLRARYDSRLLRARSDPTPASPTSEKPQEAILAPPTFEKPTEIRLTPSTFEKLQKTVLSPALREKLQETRNIYISRSWRQNEAHLADHVCQLLDKASFRMISDAEDQSRYDENRIKFIMSNCGGLAAILPDRGEGATSKYILREIEIAQALKLPCLIITEPKVRLPEHLTASVVRMTADDIESNSLKQASLQTHVEILKEEWKDPPQIHYIFVATNFHKENMQRNQAIKQVIESVTGIECVNGDEILDSQVQQGISERISQAMIVIADISGDSENLWNLNICIEAGIAIGANIELYLISGSPRQRPPFMLRDKQIFYYSDDIDLLELVHKIVFPYRQRVLNLELPK